MEFYSNLIYRSVLIFLCVSFFSFLYITFTFKGITFQSTAFLCIHPVFKGVPLYTIAIHYIQVTAYELSWHSSIAIWHPTVAYVTTFLFIQVEFYRLQVLYRYNFFSVVVFFVPSVYTLLYLPAFFSSQLTVVFISLRSPPISPQSFSHPSILLQFIWLSWINSLHSSLFLFTLFYLISLHSFIIRWTSKELLKRAVSSRRDTDTVEATCKRPHTPTKPLPILPPVELMGPGTWREAGFFRHRERLRERTGLREREV